MMTRTPVELDRAAMDQRIAAINAERGVDKEWFVVSNEEYRLLRMRRATDPSGRLIAAVIEEWDDGFQRFHGMRLAIACETLSIGRVPR
jgi:hypothetical protein